MEKKWQMYYISGFVYEWIEGETHLTSDQKDEVREILEDTDFDEEGCFENLKKAWAIVFPDIELSEKSV